MRRRVLGRTMTPVSEVSLDAQSLSIHADGVAIVEAALSQGVTLVSVSEGPSQIDDLRLVGQSLRGRDEVCLAASATVDRFAVGDPITEILTAAGRGSLGLFGLSRPSVKEALQGPAIDALAHARRLGRVKLLSVRCASAEDALMLMRSGRWDVIEIDYNLFEHGRPFIELFHEAAHAGVGLIVYKAIVPPGGGVREARRAVLSRISSSLPSLAEHVEEACVAYALRPQAVSSVAVSPSDAAMMRRIAAVSAQSPMDDTTADRLEDLVLGL